MSGEHQSTPRDVMDDLRAATVCRRCRCQDCARNGVENHAHACTNGPHCVETQDRLRARVRADQHTAYLALEEIRRLRREREALAARVAQLEAVEHG